MKKVFISGPAKEDIIHIKDFMNNRIAFKNFIHSLSKVFDMISEYPDIGVKKQGIIDSSILIYTIKRKYNIVYRIKDENIEILRILSKYQNLFAIL